MCKGAVRAESLQEVNCYCCRYSSVGTSVMEMSCETSSLKGIVPLWNIPPTRELFKSRA